MKLSELNNLLSLLISIDEFKNGIQNEIVTYLNNISKKCASSPISLQEDMASLLITKAHIVFLCNSYLNKCINEWELNYVAEAILLSNKTSFDTDETTDALMALTDREYFNSGNAEYVRNILREIQA